MSQAATELRAGGFTRLSTCDWPGELAATVFCQGCAWDCPYCHNPSLRPIQTAELISWPAILEFLGTRRGLLDGVVFSGGEPTMQVALPDAIEEVKKMGFKIGLHTSGMTPGRLASIFASLDWVGFDVKAPFASYDSVTGIKGSGERARLSLRLLLQSGIPYEVRTTWHAALLSIEDMLLIQGELLTLGVQRYAGAALSCGRHTARNPCPSPGTLAAARLRDRLRSFLYTIGSHERNDHQFPRSTVRLHSNVQPEDEHINAGAVARFDSRQEERYPTQVEMRCTLRNQDESMPESIHLRSLKEKAASFAGPSGSITQMDANDLPILKRLSLRRLLLSPRGVREPHWHANANELGYCIRGEHLVTIAGSHSTRDSFSISRGQMFFVPSGALHSIENIGEEDGEILLAFSNEHVEDFGLSGTFGAFTDAVLGNTTGLPSEAFASLKRSTHDTFIGSRAQPAILEEQERHLNPYKYNLEAAKPPIDSASGSAHTAQAATWPILQDISMFSVRITGQGMREVHWHPETAEMGYVAAGNGRMTILSPGGSVDTYEMKPGDMYFIPRAYPHHIENIASDELSILIFFDRDQPADIGGKSLVSAFSTEVLAATFKVDPASVPHFPFTAQDPLIVPRINSVDPPFGK